MTALRKALTDAGLTASEERLDAAARAALKSSGNNFERALDALWNSMANDAALLATAFHPHRHMVLGALLRKAGGGGGHIPDETRRFGASAPARPQNNRGTSGIAAVSAVARKSVLDGITTDLGRVVGDCTRDDLLGAARRSRRNGWFFEAMARPMPHAGVARDHWREADAAKVWEQAERANSTEMQS